MRSLNDPALWADKTGQQTQLSFTSSSAHLYNGMCVAGRDWGCTECDGVWVKPVPALTHSYLTFRDKCYPGHHKQSAAQSLQLRGVSRVLGGSP